MINSFIFSIKEMLATSTISKLSESSLVVTFYFVQTQYLFPVLGTAIHVIPLHAIYAQNYLFSIFLSFNTLMQIIIEIMQSKCAHYRL